MKQTCNCEVIVLVCPSEGCAAVQRSATYLLTPWCRVLLEKLTGLQLVKKVPAFYGTRKFITALTSVRHLSLSWASPIQSTYPHPTSWRSILILPTHLHLGLPSGVFPSGFPTKTLYAPLSSPILATCPTHLILLDFITRTILGEQYRSFSYSLCNLLHVAQSRSHRKRLSASSYTSVRRPARPHVISVIFVKFYIEDFHDNMFRISTFEII